MPPKPPKPETADESSSSDSDSDDEKAPVMVMVIPSKDDEKKINSLISEVKGKLKKDDEDESSSSDDEKEDADAPPPPHPPQPQVHVPDTFEEEFEKIKHGEGDLLEVDSRAVYAEAEEQRRRSAADNATEGYLLVKVPWDSSTTMWKRRWVSYRPHARQLSWCSVKDVRREAPDGYIDMSFVTDVRVETTYSGQGFCVETDGEEYSFMADSDETRDKWIRVLNEGVVFMNAEKERIKTSDDKLEKYLATFEKKEGELKIMIEGRRTWYKSVWCVMKGGMLFMYNSAGSREIKYKYALYHCKTEMYKGLNDTFILSTTDDETKRTQKVVLKAGNEENLHMWNNAIMKQRFLIESSIDSISIYQ